MIIHTRFNFFMGIVGCLSSLGFFLLFPWLTLNTTWLLLGAVFNALLTTPFWSMIHEAIHRVFNPNKKINDLAGRVMTVCFGTVFGLVQYGHLMHHRMNRQGPDLVDAYDPKTQSYWLKSLQYYTHIFGGLYLVELVTPLLLFFPRHLIQSILKKSLGKTSGYYEVAEKKLLSAGSLTALRRDAVCLYLLLGMAFFLYGSQSWILAVGVLLRGFIISFADNLPHYGTPIDQPKFAYNTYLPTPLRLYWFNFNLHRVHHEYPALPWNALYDQFLFKKDSYDMSYFQQGLKQLKGVWAKSS